MKLPDSSEQELSDEGRSAHLPYTSNVGRFGGLMRKINTSDLANSVTGDTTPLISPRPPNLVAYKSFTIKLRKSSSIAPYNEAVGCL